jgi:hypothetical protein
LLHSVFKIRQLVVFSFRIAQTGGISRKHPAHFVADGANAFQDCLPAAGRHEAGAVGMDDVKRLFGERCANHFVGRHRAARFGARGGALRILERHSNFKSGHLAATQGSHGKAVELAGRKRKRFFSASLCLCG